MIAVLGALFVCLFMKIVRTNFIDIYFHFSGVSASHDGDIITGGNYVLTQMRVFLTFLRVLILPINQNLDYDYPVSTGLLNPPLTLAGIGLIGFIIFLIFRLRRQWPLIAFGLAWILITFSINTAPRTHVIFEHKLYLISFGFILTVVCLLSNLIKDRQIFYGFLTVFIIVLSLMSFNRNQVWKNELTLWQDVAAKSPLKSTPYNGLGIAYGKQGDFIQALTCFNKAIELNPNYAEAYNNRGNTYFAEGFYVPAGSDFNKAIALNPHYAQAYANRGNLFVKEGKFAQAVSDYDKSIAINRYYPDAFINRGLIYAQHGVFSQAWNDVHQAQLLGAVINPKFIGALEKAGGVSSK